MLLGFLISFIHKLTLYARANSIWGLTYWCIYLPLLISTVCRDFEEMFYSALKESSENSTIFSDKNRYVKTIPILFYSCQLVSVLMSKWISVDLRIWNFYEVILAILTSFLKGLECQWSRNLQSLCKWEVKTVLKIWRNLN